MRFDANLQVSSAQAYTTGSAVSTDSIKKPTNKDMSLGQRMCFGFMCTVAAAGSVVATSYLLEAIGADDAALTSNVVSLGSLSVLGSQMVAGAVFEVPIVPGGAAKQYIGTRVVTTGGTLPTVSLSAFLGAEGDFQGAKFKSFPKAVDNQV
jgi:hypothetical protein